MRNVSEDASTCCTGWFNTVDKVQQFHLDGAFLHDPDVKNVILVKSYDCHIIFHEETVSSTTVPKLIEPEKDSMCLYSQLG